MSTGLYVPGVTEKDPKKHIRATQNISVQTTSNTTNIATNTTAIATANTNIATNTTNIASNTAAITALQSATYVNSIAGNSGAFTLNSASGITNATNDIKLQQASASQFGAVKVDGTTITASAGVISAVSPSQITNSLGSDVALNNTGNFFDGPSIAQGSTGTWFVSGTVTVSTSSGTDQFRAKLWDGTTVIASAAATTGTNNVAISLSGYLASPAGNLRISVQDPTSVNGSIKFSASTLSKDSTITAFRIA